MNTEINPSESQLTDLRRLKNYFPYRVVWLAISPDGSDWRTGADSTKHKVNALARKGWHAWTI
jgi:hypothetical protein